MLSSRDFERQHQIAADERGRRCEARHPRLARDAPRPHDVVCTVDEGESCSGVRQLRDQAETTGQWFESSRTTASFGGGQRPSCGRGQRDPRDMDAERRERLAQQIGQVRHFKQLFVISHDDTFEEAVDHVVVINARNKEAA